MQLDATIDETALRKGRCGELGELELRVLERRNRLPERLPLARVLDRPADCRLGGCDRAHSLQQPLLCELGHELPEALADRTEHVAVREAHVGEEELGGVLRAQADLVERAPAGETGPVALDEEERHAFRPGAGLGLGRDDDDVGELTVRDEDLLAVQHPVVAVADATVSMRCRSLPPRGSDIAIAPIASPKAISGSHFNFCSSVPYSRMYGATMSE